LLGVVGTGLAYVLNYRIIADIGATKASLVTYIIPVIAVMVGILVLDEPFETRLLIGGALTVAAIAAVNHKPRARVPEPSVIAP
jgi:drug/metabolite transporter (DMT)-like permease